MEGTIVPSTKKPSDRASTRESMPLAERVKNNWFVIAGTALVFGFTLAMTMAEQFRVNPRDFLITSLKDEIAKLKEEIAKLRTTDPMSDGKSFKVPSCNEVKIDGDWPRRVAANDSFVVKGRAPKMPGFNLWLFASRDGGPPYHPRGPVELLRGDDWEFRETGEKRGDSESKHYRIFVVGEAGEILIREYRKAMNLFMEEIGREWPED